MKSIRNPSGYIVCNLKLIPNFHPDNLPFALAQDNRGISIIDLRNAVTYHIIKEKY